MRISKQKMKFLFLFLLFFWHCCKLPQSIIVMLFWYWWLFGTKILMDQKQRRLQHWERSLLNVFQSQNCWLSSFLDYCCCGALIEKLADWLVATDLCVSKALSLLTKLLQKPARPPLEYSVPQQTHYDQSTRPLSSFSFWNRVFSDSAKTSKDTDIIVYKKISCYFFAFYLMSLHI